MGIEAREQELISKFQTFENWESKYKAIIELGKSLPPFPEERRNEDHKVKGCQSQVWLWVEPGPDGTLRLFADSDALITKGLVALVIGLYQDLPPNQITTHSLDLFKKIGLFDHLSPSRANGLAAMIKQVKTYALAYQFKGS